VDWDDVRHFLALARLRSVRAAGTSLGVSHSTVTRRVDALECRLGARLFDRSRDGFTLTDVGRQILPEAEHIEAQMSALERRVVGKDEALAGSVAVTCCDPFVAAIVLAGLRGFCAEHPEIELSFNSDSRPFDLAKREADIAIRALALGATPPESLIGREVAPLVLASYVATAHATELDPDRPGTSARWIGFDDPKIMRELVETSSYPHLPAWGAFSSLELLVQAAREGLGIVMLPTYVGDGDPSLGRLASPDLRHLANLWLLSHPDLRNNARIRATRAAVARALEHPLLSGHR
jgi:DNA-binding transcriptional LysR family regulator